MYFLKFQIPVRVYLDICKTQLESRKWRSRHIVWGWKGVVYRIFSYNTPFLRLISSKIVINILIQSVILFYSMNWNVQYNWYDQSHQKCLELNWCFLFLHFCPIFSIVGQYNVWHITSKHDTWTLSLQRQRSHRCTCTTLLHRTKQNK